MRILDGFNAPLASSAAACERTALTAGPEDGCPSWVWGPGPSSNAVRGNGHRCRPWPLLAGVADNDQFVMSKRLAVLPSRSWCWSRCLSQRAPGLPRTPVGYRYGQPSRLRWCRWSNRGLSACLSIRSYLEHTGLTYHVGVTYPAWTDNSNCIGGNPDGTNTMDIYIGRVRY